MSKALNLNTQFSGTETPYHKIFLYKDKCNKNLWINQELTNNTATSLMMIFLKGTHTKGIFNMVA